MRILFLGFVVNVTWSLPNVDIFIRTLHPDVKFHQKRLKDAKNDLERQIEEFSLSNRVKFHDLTSKKENYYTGYYTQPKLFNKNLWLFRFSYSECDTKIGCQNSGF